MSSTVTRGGKRPQLDTPEATARRLEGKLMRQLRTASLDYGLVEDGDHILVAVSGGKDSATMLHLLLKLKHKLHHAGVRFNVTAVHLDQKQPGYDGKPLREWLQGLEQSDALPFRIVEEDTYTIVTDKTAPGKTYCTMCSRLRRGILYSVAHDLGCNKLALGHHADDSIETLLLNMIHQGQMKAMPARYFSTDRDMHVIRPLIYCEEDEIRTFAEAMDFPILPCNLCGSQPDAHRAKVKLLCSTLETLNPQVGTLLPPSTPQFTAWSPPSGDRPAILECHRRRNAFATYVPVRAYIGPCVCISGPDEPCACNAGCAPVPPPRPRPAIGRWLRP